MIRILTIAVVLVLAPVSWGQVPDTTIKHRTDTDKLSVMSTIQALSHVVPLNTRLRIHWLDSVPVVRCDWKYIWGIETIGISTLPPPLPVIVIGTTFVRPFKKYDDAFKIDSLWSCDTTGWRMTACSLSVVEEGK